MLVLGIESTCDETAASIVKDGKEIISNVISSQIDLHREYGGVIPELACRRHVDIIMPVIKETFEKAGLSLKEIDLIAVANGPGLIGALLIGVHAAKALSFALNKPIVGVNHIEAHLYAAIMSQKEPITFPAIGCVLSGGHTNLVLMNNIGNYTLIGQTVDDAIGEAFDKVAKILNLPYPGGPEIERLAINGTLKYPFKPAVVKKDPFSFSFSGLKTAVLYTVKGQNTDLSIKSPVSLEMMQDIAASFQHAAFSSVISKTLEAAKKYHCQNIIFGGGVTNNQTLRKMFQCENGNLNYIWPAAGLSLDNAAMIAGLGYHKFKSGHVDDVATLEALTSIAF